MLKRAATAAPITAAIAAPTPCMKSEPPIALVLCCRHAEKEKCTGYSTLNRLANGSRVQTQHDPTSLFDHFGPRPTCKPGPDALSAFTPSPFHHFLCSLVGASIFRVDQTCKS